MRLWVAIVALLLCIATCPSIVDCISSSESAGLIGLMEAMQGFPVQWQATDTANACHWPAITCNANGSIISIDTKDHNVTLTGYLPDIWHNFTSLDMLRLYNPYRLNYGTLPPSLVSTHPTITSLTCSTCSLTGKLPSQLSPNLKLLFLLRNYFVGSIPETYSQLQSLSFHSNVLSCPLPKHLYDSWSICDIRQNRFARGDNGMMCGTVPATGHCDITHQYEDIPMNIPKLSDAESAQMVQVKSEKLLARFDAARNIILVNTKDATTGKFMEDIYWVMKFDYWTGNHSATNGPRRIDEFLGFTSDVKIVDGEYQWEGEFASGQTLLFLLKTTSTGTFKFGWKVFTHGELNDSPLISVNLFLKSPLHNGLGTYNCDINGISSTENQAEYIQRLLNGEPYATCTGPYTNFTHGGLNFDGNLFVELRYTSARFDVSFYWNYFGVADSNTVPFRTEDAAVYMNEGVPLLRSGRSETHYDFGASNVDPSEQWMNYQFPILYLGQFRNELVYDPEIILHSLFDIGNDDAVVAGAVVGSILGVLVLALIFALVFSTKFRHKVLPFTKRSHHDSVSKSPLTAAEQPQWQVGRATRST